MDSRELSYIRRRREFDGPVGEIVLTNAACARLVDLYARGEIITREETLSQMVVHLAKDWTEVMNRHFELVRSGFVVRTGRFEPVTLQEAMLSGGR